MSRDGSYTHMLEIHPHILPKLNNITIEYSQEELIELGLQVVRSNFKETDIKSWIRKHMVIH